MYICASCEDAEATVSELFTKLNLDFWHEIAVIMTKINTDAVQN